MKIGFAESLRPEFLCSGCGGPLRSPSVLSPVDFKHHGQCDLNDGLQAALLTDKERFRLYGGHVRPYTDPELTLIADAGYVLSPDEAHVRLFGGRRGLTGFEEPSWQYVGLQVIKDVPTENSTFGEENDSDDDGTG